LFVAFTMAISVVDAQPATKTPLTEYVYRPDRRNYRWNVSSIVGKGPGYSIHNIFMQSQVRSLPHARLLATIREIDRRPVLLQSSLRLKIARFDRDRDSYYLSLSSRWRICSHV